MAGRRQKHPDALAFKRGDRYKPLAVVPLPDAPTVPTCPRGLRLEASRAWRTLWESRLAGAFKDTDLPALRRWAFWFSEWLRAAERMRGGEPEMNSTSRYLKLCETTVRELEKAFGMDPLARLRLGLTLVEEQHAVAKLKASPAPREMSR